MKLTLVNFYKNFKQYADSKTAYCFAKKLFAQYAIEPEEVKELYSVQNNDIVFDNYSYTGEMDFDSNGVHDSGYRTPQLWNDLQGGLFIRWCWY